MSYSSLWVMDSEYKGKELIEYENSWLFSPIIWDVLSNKYLQDFVQPKGRFQYRKSISGPGGVDLWNKINQIVCNGDYKVDEIMWVLSNQLILPTIKKVELSAAIRSFAKDNKNIWTIKEDDGNLYYPLKINHIKERFIEVADSIFSLDEERYPYLIFKNSSIDDGVETLFCMYDEEIDENIEISLLDNKYDTVQFVEFKDDELSYINSHKYFKKG